MSRNLLGNGAGGGGATGPDTFTFDAVPDALLGALTTSEEIVLAGAADEVWSLVVRGDGTPQLSINGTWGTGGVARAGDTVQVRLTSDSGTEVESVCTLYASGGLAVEFSVTTANIWLPSLLSPRLWVAADQLGLSNDNPVTSWTDLSGLGYHMAEATNPPTFKTAILGGKPIVRFDGANDKLDGTALSNVMSAGAFTVFMLFKTTTIVNDNAGVYDNDSPMTSATGGYLGISLRSTGPTLYGYNYDGSYDAPTGIITDTTDFHIVTWRHDAGNLYLGVDGDTENSTASGNTAAMTDVLRLGSSYNAGRKFTGDMAEVLVFNTALSSGDVAKVQGYLAWKWGLEGSLPGGHDYAGGPP